MEGEILGTITHILKTNRYSMGDVVNKLSTTFATQDHTLVPNRHGASTESTETIPEQIQARIASMSATVPKALAT